MKNLCVLMAGTALAFSMAGAVQAQGEAGPLHIEDQGHFYVGITTTEVPANPEAGPFGAAGVSISGQMFVGFQKPVENNGGYPLILVHGGGGQATDFMTTPDGRDGWIDYFVAAGFDTYYVDRPAHGRSPNNVAYGELAPAPSSAVLGALTGEGAQWPGGAPTADNEAILQMLASSEPGPTVDSATLQAAFSELLEKIGPAIIVTHSAGGPSGWLSIEAQPDLVKGVVAVEAVGNLPALGDLLTWEPALSEGESVETVEVASQGEGLAPCQLQPEGAVRTLPNFEGVPILGIVAPASPMFTPSFHCTVEFINQAGGNMELMRLEDEGLEGNGHFLPGELNNGEIAQLIIDWALAIE